VASSGVTMPDLLLVEAGIGDSHYYFYWLIVAGVLLVFVALTSEAIKPIPLSYAVIYLVAGIALGPYGLGLIHWDPVFSAGALLRLSELAVLISLFACGILLERRVTWRLWNVPARLLLFAMPITIAGVALFGWAALGLPIGAAVLLGAILAPTDPVLASDVQVEGEGDDTELEFGLTAEAGLNDGLAFPFVTLGLALMTETRDVVRWGTEWALAEIVWAIPGGLAIGYGIAYVVGRGLVYVRRRTEVNASLEAFAGLGLTIGTYAIADLVGTWGFLAAFAAGLAIGRVERDAAATATTPRERNAPIGALRNFFSQLERLGEIAVMLLLGGLLRWDGIATYVVGGLGLSLLLLFVIRPVATYVSTLGSPLAVEGRVLAGWFGIRGIGSLYYLSYAVVGGLGGEVSEQLTWLVFIAVVVSVVLHGVTATPLMNWYERRHAARTAPAG
jgi:NhaP-type Na+/H+ or K+/H+ antiporter